MTEVDTGHRTRGSPKNSDSAKVERAATVTLKLNRNSAPFSRMRQSTHFDIDKILLIGGSQGYARLPTQVSGLIGNRVQPGLKPLVFVVFQANSVAA
jgi:hypothetical protein